ncbi:MAG: serine/threonine protein kinase [Lachnospiraceae bacterium]|nr:serine/threonine protein kinase [Lachnospiraceae bacterium]
MTLEERSRLSYYKEISVLNGPHRVFLVQHTESGRIFVKKTLQVYDLPVLTHLKENPVPHIPRIYDLFQEDGTLILIEEYINGTSLQDLLDTSGLPGREISVNYVLQLCRILFDLHHFRPPIIHRDIKPSNVIVSEDGKLTLIDMDAAKYAKDEQSRDTHLLGTQGYAAPEQYGFRPSGPETDIYALGVLLNVLLTGRFPQDLMAPEPLKTIVETCTKMDPEERYRDTDALARALLAAVNGSPAAAQTRTPPGWRRFLPPGFRTGKIWKMILGVLGYVVIFIVALSWRQEGASKTVHIINRIGCLGMFLSIAFFSGNYLSIQEKLHLNRVKHPALRIVLVVLADAALILAWVMVIVLLSAIFVKET